MMERSRDEVPGLEIRLEDHGMEPEATVAPAGPLTLAVQNHGDRKHNLALVERTPDLSFGPDRTCPANARLKRVAEFRGVEGHGYQEQTVDLEPGLYVLLSDVAGDNRLRAVAELTVQEAPEAEPPRVDPGMRKAE